MAQRHMDRLTSFDTSFLTNEKSNGHMAIGAIMVCEGSAPSYEDFVTHIRSRLHLLPRLRQQLAFPPLHLGTPFWVDDPDFDVHKHVSHVTLPAPGHRRPVPRADRRVPLAAAGPLASRSGSSGWPTASRTTASGSSTRPTTRWPTGSRRPTSACCSSTSSRSTRSSATEEPWEPHDAALAAPACSASRRRASSACSAARLRWLCERGDAARARRWKRAADGVVGLWEVGWNLTKPAPKVAFNIDIGPDAQLRLDDRPARRLQTDQERARRHRQRRHPGGRRRRPAALARGPRRRRRRARAAGAGPGLGPDRERARRARQPADRDARPAAGRHRRPVRAPAQRDRARWKR